MDGLEPNQNLVETTYKDTLSLIPTNERTKWYGSQRAACMHACIHCSFILLTRFVPSSIPLFLIHPILFPFLYPCFAGIANCSLTPKLLLLPRLRLLLLLLYIIIGHTTTRSPESGCGGSRSSGGRRSTGGSGQ